MTITTDYEIKLLVDNQEHIPVLAELWFEGISRHWVPNASVERATQNLLKHLNRKEMPMAFVALYKDEPIGMACLRENDGIQPGVSPWLGSLVVDPKYQGQKVGETLINAVKDQAKNLGHNVLYLLAFDATIPNLGWKLIGDDTLFDHSVAVMSIAI